MPRKHRAEGSLTSVETVAIVAVVGAIVAMAIWFLFFSGGGIGPGTV